MTDPIADMLSRVRNALAVRKAEVVLPYSTLKMRIAEIMEREGFVAKVEKIDKEQSKIAYDQLRIVLKYSGKTPAISGLRRVSKPGLRVYSDKETIPTVLNNYGIAIVSTSKGVMTNKEAKKAGIGGEVLCEIF